jgi:glycosyltransferase involved in cell wall biosynthesis
MKGSDKTIFKIMCNHSLPRIIKSKYVLENNNISKKKSFLDKIMIYVNSFFCDAVVINSDANKMFIFCFLHILFPFNKTKLIFVDVALRKPKAGFKGKFSRIIKIILLKKIDLFLLLQKDTAGFQKYYDIHSTKFRYIPFKINDYEKTLKANISDEEYVLSAGRSVRDYTTFIKAVKELDYPVIIQTNKREENVIDGTYSDLSEIPQNVKIIYGGNDPSLWLQTLAKAKILVLCTLPDDITCAGTGTYIQAMALKKCVIITDSPGTRGILKNGVNAVIVPPKDPVAVRKAIQKVWEDDNYRKKIAENGYKYAISLGGKDKYYKNISSATIDYLLSL